MAHHVWCATPHTCGPPKPYVSHRRAKLVQRLRLPPRRRHSPPLMGRGERGVGSTGWAWGTPSQQPSRGTVYFLACESRSSRELSVTTCDIRLDVEVASRLQTPDTRHQRGGSDRGEMAHTSSRDNHMSILSDVLSRLRKDLARSPPVPTFASRTSPLNHSSKRSAPLAALRPQDTALGRALLYSAR